MLFRSRNPAISLALQGGGAHGAFTWGVLDGLLEDGRLEFEGISGTSAGAMNAVVLAHGLLHGGRDGAREALARFWGAVAASAPFDPSAAVTNGENGNLSPGARAILAWARHYSPHELNPFDVNPLRDIVVREIDFERLRTHCRLKLFVAATHANTGKLRIFETREMTADALLASACLPALHRAVEIDGEPYWDGGYSANPAVFPLFYDCSSRDILLVLLSPLLHGETPHTVEEIRSRTLDLSFNATFLREMRMYAHAREYASRTLLPAGRLERRLKRTNFHLIEAEELLSQLPTETRLATSLRFLEMLRDQGRQHARTWLDANYGKVGQRSSVEIAELFY
ncbi:patatin-like phospholipase family protein [Aromatoleum bremense]|uniref:Patatin-like phospholipase family protein n=1 Tax=Aromatoleum bremense TaxID=76115 RepID=A0ABX1NWC3_9RHOO|nr:patatin-like phospholipase family protein [Aromatoleum bremense]NMG16320.1 patatin-like phospholipase family protein [Aromatoleum bremense]QTQ33619.1 Putative esterase [Aromatoleum bremense]